MPTLWDRERRTIVNNESSEIIRMLKARFLYNKSKRFSPKSTTKLSKFALHAIRTDNYVLSHT